MNIHFNAEGRRILLSALEAEHARFIQSHAFCDRTGDAQSRAMWERKMQNAAAMLEWLRDPRAVVTVTIEPERTKG